jgi:hypothetical protein
MKSEVSLPSVPTPKCVDVEGFVPIYRLPCENDKESRDRSSKSLPDM